MAFWTGNGLNVVKIFPVSFCLSRSHKAQRREAGGVRCRTEMKGAGKFR